MEDVDIDQLCLGECFGATFLGAPRLRTARPADAALPTSVVSDCNIYAMVYLMGVVIMLRLPVYWYCYL